MDRNTSLGCRLLRISASFMLPVKVYSPHDVLVAGRWQFPQTAVQVRSRLTATLDRPRVRVLLQLQESTEWSSSPS